VSELLPSIHEYPWETTVARDLLAEIQRLEAEKEQAIYAYEHAVLDSAKDLGNARTAAFEEAAKAVKRVSRYLDGQRSPEAETARWAFDDAVTAIELQATEVQDE